MAYTVVYHPEVRSRDLPKLPRNIAGRIRRAIEERLVVDPISYGQRLRHDLAGSWKLRVGDYRVVDDIDAADLRVDVLLIAHRREVYDLAVRRRE